MSKTQLLPSTMGRVALSVADLGRSLTYYQQGIGLQLHRRQNGTAYLGAGSEDLLVLQEKPGARHQRRASGLYHFALLLPSRRELARTLQHLQASGTAIGGASDHAVSEALYLTDPDGHGIEIYRDRPRDEWEFPKNTLKMTVDPFDVAGVMTALEDAEADWTGLDPETIMGHVHLHVSQMPASEHFYGGLLGFGMMARYGQQASFLSYNGYHHHLGVNTWAGVGVPPAATEAARLEWYEIRVRETAVFDQIRHNLDQASYPYHEQDGYLALQDPSGNKIRLMQL
ncbi:MAG: VOC family protein [Chloroflexota bacterium]